MTEETPVQVHSARVQGLQLHPAFCRWHYPLTRLAPFGPCCLESCPLQRAIQAGHDSRDETRLLLDRQFGISLVQLRQAMGPSWELLQDSPATLRDCLLELRSRLAARAPHRGGGAAMRSFFSPSRDVSPPPPLGNAADLLVERLAPAVAFIGLGTTGVRDLLDQLAPSGAEQGTLLCLVLKLHFQAMAAFAREGRGPESEVLAPQQEGLACLEQFLEQFERLRQLLAQQAAAAGGATLTGRGIPFPATATAASPICRATAAETEDAGMLISAALIAALSPLEMTGEWSNGVLELLGESPPADPLEAILATQVLFCRLKRVTLPDRPEALPPQVRLQLEEHYLDTAERLQQALQRWRGRP